MKTFEPGGGTLRREARRGSPPALCGKGRLVRFELTHDKRNISGVEA